MPRAFGSLMIGAMLFAGCGSSSAPTRAELTEFRTRVLTIAADEFPGRELSPSADPLILEIGAAKISLQNLYLAYRENGSDDRALADLVRSQLGSSLSAIDAAIATKAIAWEAARPRLRPQISPIEFLQQIPAAHRPFDRLAVETIVIDQETTYRYVLADDLARWQVSLDEAAQVALENLDRASQGLVPEGGAGADGVLAIATGDSYDAARILLPRLRAAAARQLGSPFHAAVPNRGALLLWSAAASPALQRQARHDTAERFANRPYPLSDAIFEVTPTSIRELPRLQSTPEHDQLFPKDFGS